MIELLPLAETAQIGQDVVLGPAGVNYPWGADATGEAFVLAVWALGSKWLDYHYDDERRELREYVVDSIDANAD